MKCVIKVGHSPMRRGRNNPDHFAETQADNVVGARRLSPLQYQAAGAMGRHLKNPTPWHGIENVQLHSRLECKISELHYHYALLHNAARRLVVADQRRRDRQIIARIDSIHLSASSLGVVATRATHAAPTAKAYNLRIGGQKTDRLVGRAYAVRPPFIQ